MIFPNLLREMEQHEDITPGTVAVLLALASFADNKTGECWPTHETIAKRAHCSRWTVMRAIAFAEEKGWLRKELISKSQYGNYKYWFSASLLHGATLQDATLNGATPMLHDATGVLHGATSDVAPPDSNYPIELSNRTTQEHTHRDFGSLMEIDPKEEVRKYRASKAKRLLEKDQDAEQLRKEFALLKAQ